MIELSGENLPLARCEVMSCMEALGCPGSIVHSQGKVLVIDSKAKAGDLVRRLGLARGIYRVLGEGEGTVYGIKRLVRDADIPPGRTRVTALRSSREGVGPSLAQDLAGAVGATLSRSNPIDLKNPELTLTVAVGRPTALGVQLGEVDRLGMRSRMVKHRPFFSPVSIEPKYARALINLSRCPDDGRLLDPFAGTGGIPMEAGIMGMGSAGADLQQEMVEGARMNLDHFKVSGCQMYQGDFQDVWESQGPFHTVATDPPYGRSSTGGGEDILTLYERFFNVAADHLPPGRFMSTIMPSNMEAEPWPDRFQLIDDHSLRVHRSLKRRFLSFKRI